MNTKHIAIVVGVILASVPALAGTEPQPPSIYYAKVPAAIEAQVKQQVDRLAQAHSLQAEESECVRILVSELEMRHGRKPEKKRMEQRAALRAAGPAAIPIIAVFLSSDDARMRHKAILALGSLIVLRERLKDDVADTQSAILWLSRRSVYDSDAKVRSEAMGGLTAIGENRRNNVPPEVIDGLKYVKASDPSADLRDKAHVWLVHFGVDAKRPGRDYPDIN